MKSRRPRGRRPGPKVPCDSCIARASTEDAALANRELCESCKAALSQPRQQKRASTVEKEHQRQDIVHTGRCNTPKAVGIPWGDDEQENHALEFFVSHSAPQLAGCFDSPFWQLMVLQAGRREPAVKHALAALGTLHEKLLLGTVSSTDERDPRTCFALEQCNKSLRYLLPQPGRVTEVGLLLTACVLFTCFEALQGNCENAILHAMQGFKIVQQHGEHAQMPVRTPAPFAVELDNLCTLLDRLHTQARGLTARECAVPPPSCTTSVEKPTTFASLCEARASLEKALCEIKVFCFAISPKQSREQIALVNVEKHEIFAPWLKAWEGAFALLLAERQRDMTLLERKAAIILKAHHLVAHVYASVDLALGEMGWDAYGKVFVAIVDLAEEFLAGARQADASVIEARWKANGVFISSPAATLTFSLGIVDPLYVVCARCRDPLTRRRALRLLATYPTQDCVWSSWSAWRVGKFLMRLEEDGLPTTAVAASDIPAERRIAEMWLDFSRNSLNAASRGRVGYKTVVARDHPQ